MKTRLAALILAAGLFSAPSTFAAPAKVVRTDHMLVIPSIAPAYLGKSAEIYVREVKATTPDAGSRGVVLFVHGAGTPAEVAFDSPYKDYSWMAYLARAGFDVFSMDMEGYGPSTRPEPMDNPCNLPPESQKTARPGKAVCASTYTQPITTMSSDWNDIGGVVNYLLAARGVKTVSLVGWSQGGPRTAGYTAQNPDKVSRLVVLAPAYNRTMPTHPPEPLAAIEHPLTSQTQAEFKANWDRQAPCTGQYEPQMPGAVWDELIKSDPGGAKWGPGVRRAPSVPSWGFNAETMAGLKTPFLMISGENDKQVNPDRVRELYADLGSTDKVFIDLACSSHNAMWEKNHLLLFKASLDWLTEGKVDGESQGMIKKGY
jgi:pimeloyl-ACP methyl ester carboxylesterase